MSVPKVGFAVGTCPKCGKILRRRRPATLAVCDCYEYCSLCGTKMQPYTPDLTPSTYTEGLDILFQCPKCGHRSTQKPIEVRLV